MFVVGGRDGGWKIVGAAEGGLFSEKKLAASPLATRLGCFYHATSLQSLALRPCSIYHMSGFASQLLVAISMQWPCPLRIALISHTPSTAFLAFDPYSKDGKSPSGAPSPDFQKTLSRLPR